MGTNNETNTPEADTIEIPFIKVDALSGENWADINLEAFTAAAAELGLELTESLDADDFDESADCGDVIDGRLYLQLEPEKVDS